MKKTASGFMTRLNNTRVDTTPLVALLAHANAGILDGLIDKWLSAKL